MKNFIFTFFFVLALCSLSFSVTNSFVPYEVDGVDQSGRVKWIGRAFADNEIQHCSQPVLNGTPLDTAHYQVDVKQRFDSGYLKFAIVTVKLDTFGIAAHPTITFQDTATCNNTGYLDQTTMASFNSGNWNAQMEVTFNGVTVTRNVKTMLAALSFADCKLEYWMQGPLVTAVKVQDCAATNAYDFGGHWTSGTMGLNSGAAFLTTSVFASLRPEFILYFVPASNTVRVDFIMNNMAQNKIQDQNYSVVLKTGAGLSTVFSTGLFTHIANTRWRKIYWSGTAPGTVRVDHNIDYLESTIWALRNYDLPHIFGNPTQATDANNDQISWSDWTSSDKGDITGYGGGNEYIKDWQGNGEGNPGATLHDLRWLTNMSSAHSKDGKNCGDANSYCAKGWQMLTGESGLIDTAMSGGNVPGRGGMWEGVAHGPYHWTEFQTGQPLYCTQRDVINNKGADSTQACGSSVTSTNTAVGHALSKLAYPSTGWIFSGTQTPVGDVTIDGWFPDPLHIITMHMVAYETEGDPYWLEELYQLGSYASIAANGQTYSFFGFSDPGTAATRGLGWGMGAKAFAAAAAPDGTSEQLLYKAFVNSDIAISEGIRGITRTTLTPLTTNCPGGVNATNANRFQLGQCVLVGGVSPALHSFVAGAPLSGENYNPNMIVSGASNASTVTLTIDTASNITSSGPALPSYGFIYGATGAWATGGSQGTGINGIWNFGLVDATHMTIPVNSLGMGSFAGQTVYMTSLTPNMRIGDRFDEPWMNTGLCTATGTVNELGFTKVSYIATECYKYIVEMLRIASFNPYLGSSYESMVTDNSSAYITTWAAKKASFVPAVQNVGTFDGAGLTYSIGNAWATLPYGNHGYSLTLRAAAAYAASTTSNDNGCSGCSGAAAWTWMLTYFPFFEQPVTNSTTSTNNDSQLKFSMVPRAPLPTLTSCDLSPGSASIFIASTQAYTALGHYSDGSTGDVTSALSLVSGSPSVATVVAQLATGIAPGSSVITGTASAITCSPTSTLTVNAIPPSNPMRVPRHSLSHRVY